ncbi:hypothetical protein GCM10028864_68440 [Microlunatus parietis]
MITSPTVTSTATPRTAIRLDTLFNQPLTRRPLPCVRLNPADYNRVMEPGRDIATMINNGSRAITPSPMPSAGGRLGHHGDEPVAHGGRTMC